MDHYQENTIELLIIHIHNFILKSIFKHFLIEKAKHLLFMANSIQLVVLILK